MKYREAFVANVGDLKDGEMKEVAVGETKILLARVNGKFHAVGATCPHYHAPLVDGVLNGERIVCPWHHACFSVVTGNMEEPPALDALPCYEVVIEGEKVSVRLPEEISDHRTPEMSKRDAKDERLFVILGGGAAGYAATQTLREDGFRGRVLMLTREDRLPYDRPNLSKDYLHGHAQPEWMPLRGDEFFDEHDIEVLREKEVTRVDAANKTIAFSDGSTQKYDALLVATGGAPRQLKIEGSELRNIFLLRSFADADRIIETAQNAKRAVVVGASFIGMETAFSLTERKLSVTVVAPDKIPFERTLGAEIGALFRQLHESHGVTFKLGANVARFEGKENVHAVVLDTGERIETDLVLVGVGVKPATGFLEGISLDKDGSVIVDENLRAAESLYAAGDIARFPDARTGEPTRIEHWRVAQQHGRVAAHNMAGKKIAYDGVPFFWTTQFDIALTYIGHAAHWDEIIFQGDVSARDFLAFYVKENRVAAVAGMNRDRDMAALEELMRLNRMPAPAQLREGQIDFVKLFRK